MKFILSILLSIIVFTSIAQQAVKTNLSTTRNGAITPQIHNELNTLNTKYTLEWLGKKTTSIGNERKTKYITFNGATHTFSTSPLPYFYLKKKLNSNPKRVSVQIKNAIYKELTREEASILKKEVIQETITPSIKISYFKKQAYAICVFVPIRKNKTTGNLEKLIGFDLDWSISIERKTNQTPVTMAYVDNSILANGNWYKLGVLEDGVHKITYSKLKSLGINPDEIDPKQIRIYGNGAGMLPSHNYAFSYDDLEENSIVVIGEDDGIFNTEDYVLFYGQSQEVWKSNGVEFYHEKNLYCDTTFYFLTTNIGTGKRVTAKNSEATFTTVVTSFNERIAHEKDRVNLIKTGREWYGEQFGIINTRDFSFQIPDIDVSKNALVKINMASHSPETPSRFDISINGVTTSMNDVAVTTGYTAIYAKKTPIEIDLPSPSSTVSIEITFNKGKAAAFAWLDFIEINARRKLKMSGNQLSFRDLESVGTGNIAQFKISNAGTNHIVWDVTDPINPIQQQGTLSGNTFIYNSKSNQLREYIVFDGTYFMEPVTAKGIPNQNLHTLKNQHPNYIIVTHPKFKKQAEELGSFHETQEGLSYVVATTQQIYNEFSSGAQDIGAIRDFVKMFYDEAITIEDLPKYLLLFGDGSYDYKDIIIKNSSLVPVYQSQNSFDPTSSYSSDDFFGLLDDNEGEASNDMIDIGIGRFPVKTVSQANDMITKLKRYYKQETFRPWRNWLLFLADDEDGNLHMRDTERIISMAESVNSNINIDKIFLDSYKQTSGAGGERYPEVVKAFNNRIDKGALLVNWVGHGGELGWALERILEVPQINAWTNKYKMPVFLTATCEFSRFDDPQRTSAGEFVLFNREGGAIALLTTTRLVYSSGNYQIMNNFYEFGFSQVDSIPTTLGDLILATKTNTASDVNSRKFALLGDPAIILAVPKYKVITTQMPDTIKGLSKVTIKGYIADENNIKINSFNGIIYPSVFDKTKQISTLNNDNPSDTNYFKFNLQTGIIFKGRATVKNGDFQFTFVVPKDIELDYGNAKISYYAEDGFTDATGNETNFFLGGYDANATQDNTAPEGDLYMNDESFVFGGMTDENPNMLAKLFDENGINTSGNGIGHDLVAVLDENTTKSIVLNEYYEAELDNYQRGTITYPFLKLAPGVHSLRLKVWDVYNNSGESNTEFIVSESATLALDHVLNYPNPFTTNTSFYFEHNQPGQGLDVKIEIFTISGRLIKTLSTFIVDNSYRVGPIYWDGLDEYGDLIGKGVYIYKLKVTVPSGESVDYFEKLVILK